jgi:mannosyltransferase
VTSYWGPALPVDRWIFVELLALAVVLRVLALGAESLWFDEIYSVAFASADLSLLNFLQPGGFAFTDKNVYHIILHFWLALGKTEFMIRLLSVLFGVVTVGVILVLTRKLFGRRTAVWAAVLVAVSPFLIWYSREARMYMLAGLFAWLAVWALVNGLSKNRARWVWAGYALCAALGLYTHSFSAFVVLAINLWAVLSFIMDSRKRRSSLIPWLAANAAVVVLAIPWLRGIIEQQSQGWWVWVAQKYGTPGLSDLLWLPVDFSLGTIRPAWNWLVLIPFAAFAAAFVWGLVPPRRETEGNWWRSGGSEWTCMVLLAAVPTLIVFVLAQFKPMFVLRYMVPFAPALAVVAGRGFGRIGRIAPRWGVAALYLVGVAAALVLVYSAPHKEDWRGAANYLAERAEPGAIVFVVDEDIKVPLQFYYDQPADFHPIWRGHKSEQELSPQVDAAVANAQEFWLVVSHTDNDGLEQYLRRFGNVVERREFQAISVIHFRAHGGSR